MVGSLEVENLPILVETIFQTVASDHQKRVLGLSQGRQQSTQRSKPSSKGRRTPGFSSKDGRRARPGAVRPTGQQIVN